MPAAVAEPSRRERRKLEVRGRILAAATELFASHGFNETKVAWICDKADVAHKTFFNHFPAKSDVMQAIAADGIEDLLASIEEAAGEETTTRRRLERFFEDFAERAIEAGPLHRELLTEIIGAAQQADTEADQARRLHDAFGSFIRKGIEDGDVTDRYGVETPTETLLGAYYALMFNWANLDDYPIVERARASARFLADVLAPSPARNEEPHGST
jgi:AcrR family transcriptional regulator